MYIQVHIHTHIYIQLVMRPFKLLDWYVFTYIHTHTYISYMHIYMQIHIHMHIYMQIHIHMHIYMQIHIHTHMYIQLQMSLFKLIDWYVNFLCQLLVCPCTDMRRISILRFWYVYSCVFFLYYVSVPCNHPSLCICIMDAVWIWVPGTFVPGRPSEFNFSDHFFHHNGRIESLFFWSSTQNLSEDISCVFYVLFWQSLVFSCTSLSVFSCTPCLFFHALSKNIYTHRLFFHEKTSFFMHRSGEGLYTQIMIYTWLCLCMCVYICIYIYI